MFRRGVTPILFYSGSDIDELNHQMWRDLQIFGKPLHFGTPNGETKEAIDFFAVTQLYGEAIPRLYRGDTPEGWKFTGSMNRAYINMLKDPDPGDQYYSYGQRLHQFGQTERARDALKECIETGVQSNRIVLQIWDREHDLEQENPPCFQFVQLRLREDNLVGAVTLFRSHCFVNADFANYGAIIRYLTDEIVEPAGGELSELINVSTSAQIGKGDVDTVFDEVGNWLLFNSFFNGYGRVW